MGALEDLPEEIPENRQTQEDFMNFDDVDFFNDLDLVEDPYPYFEYLRSRGAVVRLPRHNVVSVTGFDEGVAVMRDHDTFSSINSATGPFPPLPFDPVGDDINEQLEQHRPNMAFGSMLVAQDPPEHTRSRSLLVGLLTPQRMKENEEFIKKTIEGLIDEFIDRGHLEAISEFAYPLATFTIADLLGVPEEDHGKFLPLLGKLPGRIGGDDEVENNPMMKVGVYFYEYLCDRRANPRDDVLTKLAQATYTDGELPPLEVITTHAATMYGAGQDTTVRLIAAMMKTLGENPRLQQQLREDKGLYTAFIEEVLRLDGPVKSTYRLARKKSLVGDVEVAAGTVVMLTLGAMSRDPRKFDAPNEFRLDRKGIQQQLGFGKGVHTCIGAPLARTEAKLALEHILARMADIRINETSHGPAGRRHYDYEPNYTQRALQNIHIDFCKA
ncbi:cytochrome P450 [Haliea sp. E17]|uniref:cytochrome P450 n=1 Tax=Haliea sp. E17 TaxID=3401576 RepID=UPI003AAFC50E